MSDPTPPVTRATPDGPCPVCGGGHKCSRTGDGLILCGRSSGPVPGYRHLGPAKGDPQWSLYRPDDGPPPPPARPRPRPAGPDFGALARGYADRLTADLRARLEAALGLPPGSSAALSLIGYDPGHDAWTFPERDARGRVVGVVRRHADGTKRAVPGSARGLSLPDRLGASGDDPLLVVEGASDVLALTAAGLPAVGRPSSAGGAGHLAELLRQMPAGRDVLVVGENDPKPTGQWPGRDGAERVAGELARALGRPVGWALPPAGSKDARADLTARAGGGGADAWAAAGRRLLGELLGVRQEARAGRGDPDDGDDGAVDWVCDIRPVPVEWLWPGWLPLGMLSLVEGNPGANKSSMMVDVAARLSRGWPMPPAPAGPGTPPACEPAAAMLIGGEDAKASVLTPRLIAAGADTRRVCAHDARTLPDGTVRPICFPDDLKWLRRRVRDQGLKLVVIDPVVAHLSGEVNTAIDADVRRVLAPLARIAEEFACAVVLIRHLNKDASKQAMYRGGGSIGFIGSVRAALACGKDPDDPAGGRVVAMTKCNVAGSPASLRYRLGPGEPGRARAVVWGGECDYTSDDLFAFREATDRAEAAAEARAGLVPRCADWLASLLGGRAAAAREVERLAAAAGFREGVLRQAKARLGVVSEKQPTADGGWLWRLPGEGGEGGGPAGP